MSEEQAQERVDKTDQADLDNLLDDALEDFNKPLPKNDCSKQGGKGDGEWSEEFIQQATRNFEAAMRAMANKNTPNADSAEPNLEGMPTDFAKLADVAAKAAGDTNSNQDFTQFLTDAVQQVSKNSQDAQLPPSDEDLSKILGNLGLGGDGGGEMGDFFPMMQTMLENILSKDVLYEPIKEITDKYPDWLANSRADLSDEDFSRYNKQYDIMKQVRNIFEKDPESSEQRAKDFDEILKLMQKLQELGQPPKEIAGDLGSSINFDGQGNPQLPDISNLLGAAGFSADGSSSTDQDAPTQPDQCSLM